MIKQNRTNARIFLQFVNFPRNISNGLQEALVMSKVLSWKLRSWTRRKLILQNFNLKKKREKKNVSVFCIGVGLRLVVICSDSLFNFELYYVTIKHQ